MADNHKQAVNSFLDAWIPEFEKSVEMFTGQPVTVERGGNAGHEASAQSSHSILWQGQTFEREASGSVWIGIPTEACTALTEAAADDSPGRESLYKELLKQSFEGAAHVLSAGQSPRMVCKEAIEDGSPPSDLPLIQPARLVIQGRDPVPILLCLDSAFAELLAEKEESLAERPKEVRDVVSESSRPMERLADLELPISVVLGRATLKVREVLKLTAGSLVELDRRAGDPVEIIVHNAVVARGEVVSISGNYGVRILEVISRTDRFAIQATAASRSTRISSQPLVN